MVNILNSEMDFISDGSEFQSLQLLQLLQEKADCPNVVRMWFGLRSLVSYIFGGCGSDGT